MEEEAVRIPTKVRVYFLGKRMWGGAAPSKRARCAVKKAPKPLRVKLLMGEDATLARGALVDGMAGSTAEERRRLIEVAREIRKAPGGWASAIEETLNQVFIPAGAMLLSFGNGTNDNMDLRRTGKGVARHAELIMDALDHLRAPENAAAAAERGLLVRWPECLQRPLHECAELHAYLDAWRGGRRVRARRALEEGTRAARDVARAVCGGHVVDTCVADTKNKKAKKSLSLPL
jgi:hypothetical protein